MAMLLANGADGSIPVPVVPSWVGNQVVADDFDGMVSTTGLMVNDDGTAVTGDGSVTYYTTMAQNPAGAPSSGGIGSMFSSLPSWALPVGIGVASLMLMKSK